MYNDRRLYSPGPELKGPITHSSKPMKICLFAAFALLFAMLAFVYFVTGAAVLYIHFWVYVAVAAVIVLLLLGAGAFAIYNRMQTERSRRNAAIILAGVMLMLGTVAFAMCSAFTGMWQPIGFFDSPEGENRIVIMRSQADEGVIIEAYPAVGDHFYVAALRSEAVQSNGVIEGVEWENERMAKVLLEDIDGNDATITVDFALLYSGEEEAAE